MANPTTREEFKQKCLRTLGAPVIDINVDDEQVEDRIDDALNYYRDYHYDGSEQVYHRHQVTDQDKANKSLTMSEDFIGVTRIFPLGASWGTGSFFNIRYQMALNDMFDISSATSLSYVMAKRHIEEMEQNFIGQQFIRYNRHKNILYIDADWDIITTGDYIVIEGYKVLDPEVYSDVWSDWWLREYATQLIKRQWGENLKKFQGMQLPGGLQFNGQTIWDEAEAKIKDLEEKVIRDFSLPVFDMIG